MEKLRMMSLDKTKNNIEKIRAIFPHVLTETITENGDRKYAIDFELLKQELQEELVESEEERYIMTWPQKRNGILLANSPIAKTLRPCRADSVNFNSTQNIYIEGDNLEALKLLQETYLNKIDMIYIDPPYNTGNDFVYEDDFAISSQEYIAKSKQLDEQGNRLFQNNETSGRFHTDWLNMIYPRLKVAKDLLSDRGLIFISIDDYEVHNLRKICDEIMGSSNFIGMFVWRKKVGAGADSKLFFRQHEYILLYAKNISNITNLYQSLTEEQKREYSNPDNDERGLWAPTDLSAPAHDNDPKRIYDVATPSGKVFTKCWAYTKENMERLLAENLVWFGKNGDSMPKRKRFLSEKLGLTPRSWIDNILTSDGKKDLEILDFKGIFDYPKPVKLIKNFLDIGSTKDSIVLDFFSGSATTAHAVMQLNSEDGGRRKFIMIQLPEETGEKTEAFKAGFKTICEIGKERIRRAGKKILEENPELAGKLDTGFRVLKVDSTNMQEVYYSPAQYSQVNLFEMADNIKPERNPEDLLFQVMLDLGVPLCSKIEAATINGKRVFKVAGGFLMACFDSNVTGQIITEIAKEKPNYAVLRDNSLANDSVATNLEQIFENYSPNTIRKVL